MRKTETLKLHVAPNWNDWKPVEVTLELIEDHPVLGQRYWVHDEEGDQIGVLERDKITESNTYDRIRYDNKPRVMWRKKSTGVEMRTLWRETRTDALAEIMKIDSANVHYAGRAGWRRCGICS